jgi:hypothetical protein
MQGPGRWARFVPKRRADRVAGGCGAGGRNRDRCRFPGQVFGAARRPPRICLRLRVTRARINYSGEVQMHRAQRRAFPRSATASHLAPRGDSVVAPYWKRNHATPAYHHCCAAPASSPPWAGDYPSRKSSRPTPDPGMSRCRRQRRVLRIAQRLPQLSVRPPPPATSPNRVGAAHHRITRHRLTSPSHRIEISHGLHHHHSHLDQRLPAGQSGPCCQPEWSTGPVACSHCRHATPSEPSPQ